MSMFLNGGKKVTGIFANVNGETKKIVSAWTNKDGVPAKVFELSNGRFVAVGYSGKSYYSTNGKTWVAMSGLDSSFTANCVTYGNGRYVCLGSNGKSYYSTDGETWSPMTTELSNYAVNSVAYGNGMFVAVGANNLSYYSTDGETWSPMSGLYTDTKYKPIAVTFGDGKFVCVCNGGRYAQAINGSTEWTTFTGITATHNFIDVAYGNGLFVAIAEKEILFSTTGSGWSTASGSFQTYKSITYGNGRFVVVGTGTSLYSHNGKDWYSMTGLGTTTVYNAVTYGNKKFVCVGASGKSHYSVDGENWSAMSGLESEARLDVCYSVDGGYDNT